MLKKILLIDDEKDFSDLTSTMLEFNNLSVNTINDPINVMNDIENTHYDLIVSDLMMPNLDGFELVEKVRANANYQKTPIIILTAKTLNDDERKFLFQHQVHLLIKPFEPQGLVEQIKNLLEKASA